MFVHHYQTNYFATGRRNDAPVHVAAFQHSQFRADEQHKIRQWCYETFGSSGYLVNTDEVRWIDSIHFGEIEFSREEDLAVFLLKWSSN